MTTAHKLQNNEHDGKPHAFRFEQHNLMNHWRISKGRVRKPKKVVAPSLPIVTKMGVSGVMNNFTTHWKLPSQTRRARSNREEYGFDVVVEPERVPRDLSEYQQQQYRNFQNEQPVPPRTFRTPKKNSVDPYAHIPVNFEEFPRPEYHYHHNATHHDTQSFEMTPLEESISQWEREHVTGVHDQCLPPSFQSMFGKEREESIVSRDTYEEITKEYYSPDRAYVFIGLEKEGGDCGCSLVREEMSGFEREREMTFGREERGGEGFSREERNLEYVEREPVFM